LFGKKMVYSYAGKSIKLSPTEYIKYVEQDLGVGELFLYNVDAEGTWEGFDYDFVKQIVSLTTLPVIACGGAGNMEHIKKVLYESNANAAAIGSMSVYSKKGMGVLINFPSRADVIME
jgi:cyclase